MSERNPLRQIRASAGSGKTYALTGDFLRLLAGAGEEPRGGGASCRLAERGKRQEGEGRDWPEILAVTFTNRAAAEMKERVLSRLKDMALGRTEMEPGWTQKRAARAVESLLRDFGALNMRTIDSLLHLVVRLAALDLNLPPDFDPVFNPADLFAPLLDELAERARDDEGEGAELAATFRDACHQVLTYGGFQGFLAGDKVRKRITELAGRLLVHPDEADDLAGPDDVAARLTGMCAEVRRLAGQLQKIVAAPEVQATVNLLNALNKCLDPARPDSELPPDSKLLHKSCLDECLKAKGKGKAGPVADALYLRLTEAVDSLETEGKVLRQALRYMPFVELARQTLHELPNFQRRTGVLPAELAPVLAKQALGGTWGVSEAFCRMGNSLTHILVDEFQDTSMAQWDALRPLAREAMSRGGSLSIVGDVKQAIYGWRGGEAALFDLVPHDAELRQLAPEPELASLDRNWRSRQNIVEWNNKVFSQLNDADLARDVLARLLLRAGKEDDEGDDDAFPELAETAPLLAFAFADAIQKYDPDKPGGMVRLLMLPPAPPRGRRKGAETSAGSSTGTLDEEPYKDLVPGLLADRVEELGRRLTWDKICVLTRSNEETTLSASQLLARGIPVVTEGSLLLAEQPLIAQTVALLTFLNSPDDDSAFWTVLVGQELLPPLPGLDAAALHEWAVHRAGLKRRGGNLGRAFRSTFPDIWNDFFAPLHDTAGLLTPYDTTCEIFERWQVAQRHPEATGFLLRFLEVLHAAEEKGLTDLAGFLDYWISKGGEEKAPLPETMNAVSVMTVHKSKGLQFEAVLTPWLSFNIKAGGNPVLYKGKNLTVLAPLSVGMGEPYRLALADTAREALNLLYVAWTRAVSELHIFLPDPKSGRMAAALHELLAPLLAELPQNADGEWIYGEIPAFTTPTPKDVTPQDDVAQPPQDYGLLPPTVSARAPRVAEVEVSPCGTEGNKSRKQMVAEGLAGEQFIGDETTQKATGAQAEDVAGWRPMAWLPQLKIFRTSLESWMEDRPDSTGENINGNANDSAHDESKKMGTDAQADSQPDDAPNGIADGHPTSSRRRGTLIHHCLELLRITGNPSTDAAVAVRHGLDTFPLPVPDRGRAERELSAVLSWYAALPDAARWMAFGTPEHTLLDADGGVHRVDLLVDDGEEIVAVEYKTGTPGPLPAPAHRAQLGGYLTLLSQADSLPCRGVLVYLDRREIVPLGLEDVPAPRKAPVRKAPVTARERDISKDFESTGDNA